MKKTLDVNIAGYIYHIDQDAYDKLLLYFNKLEKHYGDNDEAKEIVKDIEQRIAELLNERKDSDNVVFSISTIDEIINILGSPEDIFGEETSEENTHTYKVNKKLYRDDDKRIFGGVAAGISAYLGLPVLLIRTILVIFCLLGYGLPFIIYVILWATVPKAITPLQKLEMKGEPINVSNIEKTIKSEYEEVKDNLKKSSPKIKSTISKFGDVLYDSFSSLGKVISILIGTCLAGLGIIVIISFISSLFLANSIILPFVDFNIISTIPDLVLSSANLTLFYICLFLIICIPFFLITYLGFRLIFKFKSGGAIITLTCLGLWIFGIVNLAIIGGNQFKNFKEKADNYTIAANLDSTVKDVIYINNRNNELTHDDDAIVIKDIYFSNVDDYTVLYGKPQIIFEKSETSSYELIIKRQAKDKTKKGAFKATENISYNWNLQDSILHLDRYFNINNDIKWKDQQLTIFIKIPVDKKICLDDYTYEHAEIDNDNFKNFYRNYKESSCWIMTEKGILINENEIE